MRRCELLFLIVMGANTVALGAPVSTGVQKLTRAEISQFNSQVAQAVSRGATWPCSPLLLTYELLGSQAEGSGNNREIFCRGGANDTTAVVLVRRSGAQGSRHSAWVDMRFRRLGDQTWRLVGVDSLPVGLSESKLEAMGSVWPVGFPIGQLPAGAKVIQKADIVYDADRHLGVQYSANSGGLSVKLVGNQYFPFRCLQPDSTTPIAIHCGPSPYSVQVAELAVLVQSDFSISVLGSDLSKVGSVSFSSVVPGPYVVKLGGDGLKPDNYHIEVWYHGKPLVETLRSYYGPK